MPDSGRVAGAVGFLVGAVSVTLLFLFVSIVAIPLAAGGAGIAYLAVGWTGPSSTPTGAAQLGLGLGLLFGLPLFLIVGLFLQTAALLLSVAPSG